ncbi:MAG TPA: hypothetical protein DCP92_16685 [Nitrospiraceae bacterium]|jgi:hypothetical protein|nr:hypothetical protein [Nitrospiraceae bacterium]
MKKIVILCFIFSICIFSGASLFAGNVAKSPEFATLDSIANKYEAVIFTHAKHASLAGRCGSCHHQHGNSESLPCKECHSLTRADFEKSVSQNFMACKNCHAGIDRTNPGMPGLKVAYHQTCFQCHRGMGNIGLDPKGCTEICHAKKEQIIGKK